MRILPAFLALLVATLPAFAQAPKPVLTGDKNIFQTAGAKGAQQRYFDTLARARLAYAAELDPAIKAAMTAGSLDEANAINQLKKDLAAGAMPPIPGTPSKIPAVNEPRVRFERIVGLAQRQYTADLQPALKAAMAAALLDEANAINAELKGLATIAPPAATPSVGLPASSAGASGSTSMTGRTGPGLLMTRYPLHPSQKDGNKGGGYVPYQELGKPLGAPKTIKSLAKWPKELTENVVAVGFLRVDKPGTYGFKSWNDWDRNELLIDGVVVCKFRDGDVPTTVELTAGLHPIVSVGYANVATWTHVQWKPPGAPELTDIPATALSH